MVGDRYSSRILPTGEKVHLVRPPGCMWFIRYYDWTWLDGLIFMRATVSTERLNWQHLEFGTEEDAYAFVAGAINKGEAPSIQSCGHPSPE